MKWIRLLIFSCILIIIIIATVFVIRGIVAQFSPHVNTSVLLTGSIIGILIFDVIPLAITMIRMLFKPVSVPQPVLALALVVLILVIIVGGINLAAAVHADQTTLIPSPGGTSTPTPDNTRTSQAIATAGALVQATASAQAQVTADAQATAQAQATAMVVAANPDPYPFGGQLVLIDSLQANTTGAGWETGSKSGDGKHIGTCSFASDAYHVTSEVTGYFNDCFAQHSLFQNFVEEVQMTIVKGDCGGLLFWANASVSEFYNWTVCRDGTWKLFLYFNRSNGAKVLKSGTFSPENINTLAVAANASQFTLYSNGQFLLTLTDTTFTSGVLAVTATDRGNTTEVAYNNLRVWALSSS